MVPANMADSDPHPSSSPRDSGPLSGLAVVAIVLAFIPFLGMFGTVFGLLAHRRIVASPRPMRGGRLALAAMLVGCGTTLISLFALRTAQSKLFEERDIALDAMFTTVFSAIESTDLEQLDSVWVDSSSAVAPTREQVEEAAAWLAAHAGAYRGCELASGTQSGGLASVAADLSLHVRFERDTVLAAVRVRLTTQPTSLTIEPRLYWLVIEHPEWGRIELGETAAREASDAPE